MKPDQYVKTMTRLIKMDERQLFEAFLAEREKLQDERTRNAANEQMGVISTVCANKWGIGFYNNSPLLLPIQSDT